MLDLVKKYNANIDDTTINTIIPYYIFVDDGIVLQKDGILQAVIKYSGVDMDSLPEQTIEIMHQRINDLILRLPENYHIYIDVIREINSYYPSPQSYSNEAVLLMETERKFYFVNYSKYYDNIYYMNILYKPNVLEEAIFGKLVGENIDAKKIKDEFCEVVKSLSIELSNFVNLIQLKNNEILEYLYFSFYYQDKKIECNNNILKKLFFIESIFDKTITVDKNMLKISDSEKDTYVKFINITGIPGQTFNGMFNDLSTLDIDYRYIVRFIRLTKDDALKIINKYQSHFIGQRKTLVQSLMEMATKEESKRINTGADRKSNELEDIKAQVTTGDNNIGYLTITFILYGENKEEVESKKNIIAKYLSGYGILYTEDRYNIISTYMSTMPGNIYGNCRRYLMTVNNLVDLMPLYTTYRGSLYNNITNSKIPHVVCGTRHNTVFYLNLCVGDVGHSLVIGPTGSGKSTFTSMLALSFLKYQPSRVIIFDKDRSSRQITYIVEGDFHDINDVDRIEIQPLRYLESESDILYAQEYIELLCSLQNVSLDSKEKVKIYETLKLMSEKDYQNRVLSTFLQYVNNEKIANAIRVYTKNGIYGDILDNYVKNEIEIKNWTVFEMSDLMQKGKQILLPVIYHIFHMIDKCIYRSDELVPTLIILDEAWLFFDNPIMEKKIKDWLKTLRKFKSFIVFATQELNDILNVNISQTLVSQTATKIYLPNPEAMIPSQYELYKKVGLTDIEIRLISTAVPKREYYIKNANGSRLFNLALGKLTLNMITNWNNEFLDSIKDKDNKLYRILENKGLIDLYKATYELYAQENNVDLNSGIDFKLGGTYA